MVSGFLCGCTNLLTTVVTRTDPSRLKCTKMHIVLWNPEKVPLGSNRTSKAKFKKRNIDFRYYSQHQLVYIDRKPFFSMFGALINTGVSWWWCIFCIFWPLLCAICGPILFPAGQPWFKNRTLCYYRTRTGRTRSILIRPNRPLTCSLISVWSIWIWRVSRRRTPTHSKRSVYKI